MTERGFTLVELLVAAALVLVIAAAASALSTGMHRAFERSVTSSELTARARAGLALVTADLHRAGSGVAIGPALQGLADVAAVVLPRRSLDDPAFAAPFSAVTVLRASGAQGVVRDRALAGTTVLQLDAAAPSVRQDGSAGLQPGDAVLVIDTARAESAVVGGVDAAAWRITTAAPLRHTFEPGTLVAAVERTTYGLRTDADGNTRLVRRTSGGAEQPVVDRVAQFDLSFWAASEPPMPGVYEAWYPTYGPLPPPLDVDDERDAWDVGENCILGADGAGARLPRLAQRGPAGALVELTPADLLDGPWCPDAMDAEAFDADLLRLRRIDLRLRVDDPALDESARVRPLSLSVSVAVRQR
jgi:prepilin-type N-terminal cleavage/methylation domain-containing protein